MPLAAMAGIGALGSIGSALIGSNSASSAADKQMQAAQQAAQLQQQGSTNALNYQNGIYGQTEQNLNPYINAGGGALNNLSYLMGVSPTNTTSMVQGAQPLSLNQPQAGAASATPSASSLASGLTSGGGLVARGGPALPQPGPVAAIPSAGSMSFNQGTPNIPQSGAVAGIQGGGVNGSLTSGLTQPGAQPSNPGGGFGSLTSGYGQTFQAPTDITEQNDPGYQARLKLGTDAIQRSAAARGGVLTGGTARDLSQFGQDYASNEYGNVYNRALQGFNTNYGVWNNDNNNIYNRLMGLSGAGQQAATNLGSFGQASSNNVMQNLLGTGQQIGQDYQNAGAANASGIVGAGNAWSGAVGNTSNNLQQLLLMKQLGLG